MPAVRALPAQQAVAWPTRKGKLGKPNLCRYRGYADMGLELAVSARLLLGFCGSEPAGLSA